MIKIIIDIINILGVLNLLYGQIIMGVVLLLVGFILLVVNWEV